MGGQNGGPGDGADGGDGEEGGDRVKGGGHALFSHHRQALPESRCYHAGHISGSVRSPPAIHCTLP